MANTNSSTRQKMEKILKKQFPNMWVKDSEDWNAGIKGGLWTGEGSTFKNSDGVEVDCFAYWSSNDNYEMGVHVELMKVLRDNGWWAENQDAGTVLLIPN